MSKESAPPPHRDRSSAVSAGQPILGVRDAPQAGAGVRSVLPVNASSERAYPQGLEVCTRTAQTIRGGSGEQHPNQPEHAAPAPGSYDELMDARWLMEHDPESEAAREYRHRLDAFRAKPRDTQAAVGNLGQEWKRRRKLTGLTIEQAARRVGVTPFSLWLIEKGLLPAVSGDVLSEQALAWLEVVQRLEGLYVVPPLRRRVTLFLDEPLLRKLQELAELNDISPARLARRFIAERITDISQEGYFTDNPRKTRPWLPPDPKLAI